MKKTLFLLAMLTIAMFALSGCSNNPANADSGDLKVSVFGENNSESGNGNKDVVCVQAPGKDGYIAWKNCIKENKN